MRTRRRLLLRLLLGGTVVGLLVVIAAAWVGYRALHARDELLTARTELTAARTDASDQKFEAARAAARRAQTASARADSLTHDPVWAVAARVPVLGNSVRTTRSLASAAHTLTSDVVTPLADLAPGLDPSRLRKGASTVDLLPLQRAGATLTRSVLRAQQVRTEVAATPRDHLPGALADARSSVLTETDKLVSLLRQADQIAAVVPTALGIDQKRRWFVAVQTPVEARGTGGLLGGLGTIVADHGHIEVEKLDTNSALSDIRPVTADVPADYLQRWLPWRPLEIAINSGVSPHFPYAASILSAAWEQHTGNPVDGVFTVDPVVLGYLLRATGPVTLSDGTRLDAGNAARWVLHDAYALYSSQAARDARLTELMQKTISRLLSRAEGARGVVKALQQGSREGRVLVAMPTVPAVQSLLATLPIGGTLPAPEAHAIAVTLNDAGASKLDYYERTRIDYAPGACTGSSQASTVKLTLTNTAPRTGLPAYVTTRLDVPRGTVPLGQRKDYWSIYVPLGTVLTGATLDGRPVGMETGSEGGHPVLSAYVTLDPGSTHVLVAKLVQPARPGTPRVKVQPLVSRPVVSTRDFTCPA